MPAQELPVLPADKNITSGSLDNGITYYVASNNAETGKIDVALVQRSGYSSEDSLSRGGSVVHGIGALATLPRFKSPSPLKFLVSNAVWPGPDGYVTISDDATVFRFRNVPVTQTMEAVDSTLLMVFEIINAAPGAKSGRYPTGAQAIVISGDITAPVVKGKLNMLSMLIDKGGEESLPDTYSWQPSSEPEIRRLPAPVSMLGTFSLTWRSPRIPREQMQTIQPLASGLLFKELAVLSEKRLSRALRDAEIAYTGLEAKYVSSAETSGDETFTVSVTVAMRDYKEAARLVVSVMADIDKNGTSVAEYRDVDCKSRADIALTGGTRVRANSYYSDKCISSFLYGTSLATEKSNAEYLTGKAVSSDVYLRLFNNFSAAILDGSKNLIVTSQADTVLLTVPDIKSFLASWNTVPDMEKAPLTGQSDTLSFTLASAKKIKLKEEQADPMAGGLILTYSNGMRVIYKKTDSKGLLRYSLNMKGGWSSIPELRSGEGAYVEDMLLLGNIGSMSGQRFRDMLAANGIEMNVSVTPNDMSIRGSAPSNKLMLLMKALAAVSGKRSVDAAAFTKYCHSKAIEHMLEARSDSRLKSLTDSLLCPKNRYVKEKLNIGLPKNLPVKSETYFSRQFSNMGNSVLIITGDVSEAAVKKSMLSSLGRFPSGRTTAPRFRNEAEFSKTLSVKTLPAADDARIELGFTTPTAFGQAEFMTAGIAVENMEAAVNKAVVPLGWNCQAVWDLVMFPDERLTARLHLSREDYRSMPASMVPEDSVQVVLATAQRALDKIAREGISSEAFSMGRSYWVGDITTWSGDPEYMLRLFELRYNYGRDFITGLKEKADRLRKEDVDAEIRALVGGGSSVIVIPKKYKPLVLNEVKLPEPEMPVLPERHEQVDSTGLLQLYKEYFLWQSTEQ
ncbi:MAG: hypothetical protein IJ151_07575 [Bacteroidales bacterium]|nr:hypothetical protein [Bacteroidales bacterium]